MVEGETFQSWLQTRNSKLWLSGIPGAGKTILAASLMEETLNGSRQNHAVSYYYCDYKDSESQNPIKILESLASQLGRQVEEAFVLLHEFYKTCNPNDQVAEPELSVLIQTIVEMTSSLEEVSIIVDGLDECGDNATTVIESLCNFVLKDQSNTRLLLLSQDLYNIGTILGPKYAHLEIAAKSEDQELFVEAELEARKDLGRGKLRLRIKSQELRDHIKKTLVERATEM